MKMTFDLPPELIQSLKLRALHDGRKLKDATADILRNGLATSEKAQKRSPKSAVVFKDKKTGLPVIKCRRAAPPGEELTPAKISELLMP
jgi:plasmid stability protein